MSALSRMAISSRPRSYHQTYFPLVRTAPVLGRFFAPDDDALPFGKRVVVLSEGVWRQQFGGARAILDRPVSIDGVQYTVIGVAPAGFTGADLSVVDLWLPLSTGAASVAGQNWATNAQGAWLTLTVRTKPATVFAKGDAYITRLFRSLPTRPSWSDPEISAHLHSIRGERNADGSLGTEARITIWLSAVSFSVLLIAWASAANLFVGRALAKRREAAIRIALGSSRMRLISQAICEGVVLALLGGCAGALCAHWAVGGLHAFLIPNIGAVEAFGWKGSVATVLAAIVLGLTIGLFSARRFAASLEGDLRAHHSSLDPTSRRLQAGLIVVQVMLSTMLLVACGLFLRSLTRSRSASLGFDPSDVLAVYDTPEPRTPAALRIGADAPFDLVSRLPGLVAVSRSMTIPFSTLVSFNVRTSTRDSIPIQAGAGPYGNYVSPDYFGVLKIPLMRGRVFSRDDSYGAAPVAIVNETMAQTLWRGKDAIGQCLIVQNTSRCATIVGVVSDVHQRLMEERRSLQLYLPFAQQPQPAAGRILLRLRGHSALIPQLRQELADIEPSAIRINVRPLDELIATQRRPWQVGSLLFGSFALMALIVACFGTYSVIAHSTVRRSREIGLRLTLGATPVRVLLLVVKDGVRVGLAGLLLGTVASLLIAPHLSSLLFRTSPRDGLVYGVAGLVLMVAVVGASGIPALRAARSDPTSSMRAE